MQFRNCPPKVALYKNYFILIRWVENIATNIIYGHGLSVGGATVTPFLKVRREKERERNEEKKII